MNVPSFIAGVNALLYRRYLIFYLVFSTVWCGVFLLLGYSLGSISVVSDSLDYLMDLVFTILAAAIITTLVLLAGDCVLRKNRICIPV